MKQSKTHIILICLSLKTSLILATKNYALYSGALRATAFIFFEISFLNLLTETHCNSIVCSSFSCDVSFLRL